MQKAETQVIFYLLQNKENVGKTIRVIASATGVSVGAVHSTLTDLTNRGFIVDDGKTRLLRKRQSLIVLWTPMQKCYEENWQRMRRAPC